MSTMNKYTFVVVNNNVASAVMSQYVDLKTATKIAGVVYGRPPTICFEDHCHVADSKPVDDLYRATVSYLEYLHGVTDSGCDNKRTTKELEAYVAEYEKTRDTPHSYLVKVRMPGQSGWQVHDYHSTRVPGGLLNRMLSILIPLNNSLSGYTIDEVSPSVGESTATPLHQEIQRQLVSWRENYNKTKPLMNGDAQGIARGIDVMEEYLDAHARSAVGKEPNPKHEYTIRGKQVHGSRDLVYASQGVPVHIVKELVSQIYGGEDRYEITDGLPNGDGRGFRTLHTYATEYVGVIESQLIHQLDPTVVRAFQNEQLDDAARHYLAARRLSTTGMHETV